MPEKSCVFLSFLDGATAAAFHADATIKKLALHGQELKIGWGKPSPVPAQVGLAISQSNASRNVYVGGLDEGLTEEQLRDDLSRFGLIDQVKIVRDKNIGFVHFLSISVATKVRRFPDSLKHSCELGFRLSTLSQPNPPGPVNVSTTVKIVVPTSPNRSRQRRRLHKPPQPNLSSRKPPHCLRPDNKIHSEVRRSPLTRRSLGNQCKVWLALKD